MKNLKTWTCIWYSQPPPLSGPRRSQASQETSFQHALRSELFQKARAPHPASLKLDKNQSVKVPVRLIQLIKVIWILLFNFLNFILWHWHWNQRTVMGFNSASLTWMQTNEHHRSVLRNIIETESAHYQKLFIQKSNYCSVLTALSSLRVHFCLVKTNESAFRCTDSDSSPSQCSFRSLRTSILYCSQHVYILYVLTGQRGS